MKKLIGLVLCISACGCDASTKNSSPVLDGYGSFKFGESFDEALVDVSPSYFSSYTLADCLRRKAVRGCVLRPKDNLTSFTTLAGVPYTIELSFNRLDHLTDIELSFSRDTMDSPEEKTTVSECRQIHERALDWAVKTYGAFNSRRPNGKVDGQIAKTLNGNSYEISASPQESFVAGASREFPGGRSIVLLSSFIPTDDETSCRVGITFGDADVVERWKLSDDEERELKSLTGG